MDVGNKKINAEECPEKYALWALIYPSRTGPTPGSAARVDQYTTANYAKENEKKRKPLISSLLCNIPSERCKGEEGRVLSLIHI